MRGSSIDPALRSAAVGETEVRPRCWTSESAGTVLFGRSRLHDLRMGGASFARWTFTNLRSDSPMRSLARSRHRHEATDRRSLSGGPRHTRLRGGGVALARSPGQKGRVPQRPERNEQPCGVETHHTTDASRGSGYHDTVLDSSLTLVAAKDSRSSTVQADSHRPARHPHCTRCLVADPMRLELLFRVDRTLPRPPSTEATASTRVCGRDTSGFP